MINKDYILRMAEAFGRELAILMHLRTSDNYEEELIAIDDLLFRKTGLNSSLLNALPETTLIQMLSPLGRLNVEACLWLAGLLMEEGDVYAAMNNDTESFYRNAKALYLFIEAVRQEHIPDNLEFHQYIHELQEKLSDYELPVALQQQIMRYKELQGYYDQAENILFDMLEKEPGNQHIQQQGTEFYQRLQQKSDEDLRAGNLAREEVEEGFDQMKQKTQQA